MTRVFVKPKNFDTWEEAFDYCREANFPVFVTIGVDSIVWRIFPSGSYVQVGVQS